MGEQPSTNGLSLHEATSTSRGTLFGVKLLGCFLSAEDRTQIQNQFKEKRC